MQSKKLRRAVVIVALTAAGFALFALLLPLEAPFLLGLLAALIAEKPAELLSSRLHLNRGLGAFFCVLTLYALLFGGIFLLCRLLCGELAGFIRQLPTLLGSLSEPLARIETWLYAMADRLPDGLGTGLHEGVRNLFESGSVLGRRVYDWFFRFASGFLEKLPQVVLFTITGILSGFMFCAELPKLRTFFQSRLPTAFVEKAVTLRTHIRSAFGGWLLAQLKLMGVTFLIVTLGLMLLGVAYPFLFSLLIALVDALPVFGTGIFLIPWSLLTFLRGDTGRGIGFLVLYAAAALTRQALEPRFVGRHMGLDPLLTLAGLYAGFRLFGIPGMIFTPMAVMVLKQLLDAGLQKGEK